MNKRRTDFAFPDSICRSPDAARHGRACARLWWIQVAHGAEWTAQLRGSSQATVRIPSVRGEIKDRNGLTLVQNRASYEVDFYLPEMVKGYRERFGSASVGRTSRHHQRHAEGCERARHHQDRQ